MWLSADPLAEKYPGWSPFNYTMDNPVVFYDPDGNEIKIAGNKTIAMNDMKELAGGSNAKYVTANADGVISLSKDYKYEAGSGAELLYNLVNNENSFTHEVGYSTNYSSAKGKNVAIDLQNPNDAMGLASAVKGGMQNNLMPTMQPKENQGNAHILISPTATWSKDGKPVSRTNIIFHELKEKLLMVTQGLIKYGSEGNTNTAHYKAGQAGIKRASVDNIDSNGADGSVDKKETK